MFFQLVDDIIKHCDLIGFQYRQIVHREKGEAVTIAVTFAVPGGKPSEILDRMSVVYFFLAPIVYPGFSAVRVISVADLLHVAADFLNISFINKPDQDRVAFGFGELFVKQNGT